MSNCELTYRMHLLRFPSLHDCPLDVSISLFVHIGTGFDWDKSGNLTYYLEKGGVKAWESKIATDNASLLIPIVQTPEESSLDIRRRLEAEAKQTKYKFVRDNIEEILRCSSVTTFFSSNWRKDDCLVKHPNDCLPAFTYPDNIQDDWAKALESFLSWWLWNLCATYQPGSSSDIDTWTWWPDIIKKFYKVVKSHRDKLYEKVHGFSMESTVKLSEEILSE
jgi:hypothetical protein